MMIKSIDGPLDYTPNTITIFAWLWTEYFSCVVIVDGLAYRIADCYYGHGEYYKTFAHEWLINNGFLNKTELPLWLKCQNNSIRLNYYAADVARKGDM